MKIKITVEWVLIVSVLMTGMLLGVTANSEEIKNNNQKTGIYLPKVERAPRTNIIFLIGDGMGVAYTSAYRFYADNPNTPEVERTIFDEMLVGMSTTYPDKINDITDSAAAATALTTGRKTYDGAIGMGLDHKPIETIFERAKKMGYLTGVAVTCQVNHATPAAFFAHEDSRQDYNEIADQYLDQRINGKPKFDLLFGGGQDYFIRKDRNLVAEFLKLGYSYTDNLENLKSIQKLPAIGLFAKVGMTSSVDSDHPNRLAEMTDKALQLLNDVSNKDQPFFLMLEASQIDWCGHANDVVCAMGEVNDMAQTMKIIKKFIDKNPNTIFVATADHSTGGLSMGSRSVYQWKPQVIKQVKATAPEIARRLLDKKENWMSEWLAITSIELDSNDKKLFDPLINAAAEKHSDENMTALLSQIKSTIDKYSFTGWTTHAHTGEDVQIFSYGKGWQQFRGSMDNTDIAKKLFGYLK